jgi:hypothetical protein
MEMEQMLGRLLKEITDEIKEDMYANGKADQEEMRTNQEDLLARMEVKTDTNQERTNASLREEIHSGPAEMRSMVNAWIADMKDDRRETMSCQVTK